MPIFEFYIPDMVCISCSTTITNALKNVGKIKNVAAHYDTHCLTIETETFANEQEKDQHLQQMQEEMTDVGYTCQGSLEIPSLSNTQTEKKLTVFHQQRLLNTKKIIHRYWLKGLIGTLSGAMILILSALGIPLPMLGMYAIGAISTALTLYFGKETYQHAVKEFVKAKTLSMNSLFTVSTLAALGISIASLFIPGLPMMFDAALLILGFKNIGKGIEESAKLRLEERSFRDSVPAEIILEGDAQKLTRVSVKQLNIGDIIRVYKGQKVPVDGVCLSKNTIIYKNNDSGKTTPQPITENDPIDAGWRVPEDVHFIQVRVTLPEEKSFMALMDRRIQAAKRESSDIEDKAAAKLKYFVPSVFAIAIVSGLIVSFLLSPILAIQSAISVLVSACPCTLGLITSLAMKAGINKAAQYGISVKNGKSIQAAAKVNVAIFDLTGTLTTGIPHVIRSTVPARFLALLNQIETESKHPIAQAICRYTTEQKASPEPLPKLDINKSQHTGLIATTENTIYCIGNSELMHTQGISIPDEMKRAIEQANAEHVIYFAENKKIQGYILLEEPLRPDAVETVAELQRQGIAVHLCTGAELTTAQKYADRLNIPRENIKANCKGDTKTAYVRQLKEKNCVAMVGDDDNDAEAVTSSHFGVAVQSASGSAVTQANAHAIIKQNSLWSLVMSIAIAKQTLQNIKQNFAISFFYNFVSMIAFSGPLLALGFAVNPALGAALMVLQTVFVLLNVARLAYKNVPKLPSSLSPKESNGTSWQSTHGKLSQLSFSKLTLDKESQPSGQFSFCSKKLFSAQAREKEIRYSTLVPVAPGPRNS